ncbi:hypothetical protein KKA00_02475, partial [bacterium]|nr:hypothetical protein [bacterium]
MNSRLLMVAFLCACLFTVPVAAQDSLNVNLIGSWCASEWEGHYNIQVDENLAFCSTGSSGLRIVDISDPHACTEIGTFIPGGSVTKTVVNDTLAFLTQYYGDVLIVSVADPANPSLISEIETVSGYGDIELVESYLYVLDSDSGVYIFDVSDPYQIVELNSYYNPDILYITDIEVIDSLLFVVEHTYFGAQLRSLNVSDPANIIEIGLFDELAETSGGMQYHDGFGYFKDNWFRVIQIVDLTDPAFPTSASSCSNDNNIWGYTVGNGCLYVSDEDTLKIYDVANPYNCQMANTLAPFCYGTAFYIDNERMVASGPVVDFEVFDVSSPAEPLKVSEFGRSGDIYHMKWVGDKLYILEALSGLRILDVAIPSEPVELGYLTTLGEPWDFNVEGDYAYIMDAVEGFEIVDISNPEIPELISTFERPDTFVVDVCAEGNSVYLVTGVDNFSAYLLESFDMSNPSDPVRLDFLQFGTSIYGKMDVANNLISLKFGSEFYFINAADPSNLWVESSLNISGYTILAAAGTTVCLAGSDGFECVDVSDPANPLIGNPITTADHLF